MLDSSTLFYSLTDDGVWSQLWSIIPKVTFFRMDCKASVSSCSRVSCSLWMTFKGGNATQLFRMNTNTIWRTKLGRRTTLRLKCNWIDYNRDHTSQLKCKGSYAGLPSNWTLRTRRMKPNISRTSGKYSCFNWRQWNTVAPALAHFVQRLSRIPIHG